MTGARVRLLARGVATALSLVVVPGGVRAQKASDPRAIPWPTKGWETATPESQGFDSGILADAFDFIREKQIPIHSLQVVRNGRLVLDAYFFPFHDGELHEGASVTKSITSTLVGIAIGKGNISSVRALVPRLFPEYQIAHRDPRKDAITIEDLLTMTSGLDCRRAPGEITLQEMRRSQDWVKFMLDLPMVADPGRQYSYCSGGMHLLSAVVSRATGISALDFARRELFAPLGIDTVAWPGDSRGNSYGWGDLHLQPRDMARIGYLWLNGGRWKDRQVVPEAWMRDAVREHSRADWGEHQPYGYGMWLPPRTPPIFEAVGRGSQRITVIPARSLVVVFTGGAFEPGDVGAFIGRAMKSDSAISENSPGQRRLAAAIARASQRPSPATRPSSSPMAQTISGKRFDLEQNGFGLRSLRFDFAGDTASLSVEFADGRSETHSIGLDGVPLVSPNGRFRLPVAVTAAWETPTTLALRYDEVGNINDVRFRMTFSGDAIDLEGAEVTGGSHEKIHGRLATGATSPSIDERIRPKALGGGKS
jgi:CubicO group peptidase (beta-lactamase class C family)